MSYLLNLDQPPPRSAVSVQMHQQPRRHAEYDPKLLKPVHVSGAKPSGLHPDERARLESERGCLIRERDTVQRGIDYITDLLAIA